METDKSRKKYWKEETPSADFKIPPVYKNLSWLHIVRPYFKINNVLYIIFYIKEALSFWKYLNNGMF